MIYYELLREYKRHCSPEELETLQELDRVTAPIEWPKAWPSQNLTVNPEPWQPLGHTG